MSTEDAGGDDPVLTTDEVAALFRVDRKTVVTWITNGKLPAFKTPGGGKWLVRESDARAYREGGQL